MPAWFVCIAKREHTASPRELQARRAEAALVECRELDKRVQKVNGWLFGRLSADRRRDVPHEVRALYPEALRYLPRGGRQAADFVALWHVAVRVDTNGYVVNNNR